MMYDVCRQLSYRETFKNIRLEPNVKFVIWTPAEFIEGKV